MTIHPFLAHLNPEQLSAGQKIAGTILLEAGPGTGKTNTATSRAAFMVDGHGINPMNMLMLTFTNKAADEMKERVVDKIGLDGHRMAITTFHKFVARWILSPNQKHPFFVTKGFEKGFICLDQEDASKLVNESMKLSHPDIAKILEIRSYTPKRVMSWLSKVRAQRFDAKSYHHQLLLDDPLLKEAWSDVARRIAIHFDNDSGAAFDNAAELDQLLKKHPKVIDLALCHVWKKYKEQCLSVAGIDYDDMLGMADQLMTADTDIAKRLAAQFQYISVDEMQDTNPVQMSILSQIGHFHGETPNLFMVGDPRQSIYGFRAADVTIMTKMSERYPQTETISLVRNYRSSKQQIVTNNAHALTMGGQISDGQLIPHNEGNEKGQLNVFEHDYEEAAHIAGKIMMLLDEGVVPGEIAVLYRARGVKNEVEKILALDNIPYTVIGDTTFWECKEVKDAVAFARFCSRPNDVMAASRVFETVKLGATGQLLRKNVKQYGNNAKDYIAFIAEKRQRTKPELKRFADRVCMMQAKYFMPMEEQEFIASMGLKPDEWKDIRGTLSNAEYNELMQTKDNLSHNNMLLCVDVIKGLWSDFALPQLKKEVMAKVDKKKSTMDEALEELNTKTNRALSVFKHLHDLVSERTPFNDAVDELSLRVENAQIYDSNTVQLMTLHAAKGLEFGHVFLPGLESENFFRGESAADPDTVEEEGRVFFVGISRDKHCKYLSYAHSRYVNGQQRDNEPLMFIDNVIDHLTVTDHTKRHEDVALADDNHNHVSASQRARLNELTASQMNDNAFLSPAQMEEKEAATKPDIIIQDTVAQTKASTPFSFSF